MKKTVKNRIGGEIGDGFELKWYDSRQIGGWTDKKTYDNLEIQPITTLGYYIGEDDLFIVVCDSISEYQYNNPFAILKASITSIRKL